MNPSIENIRAKVAWEETISVKQKGLIFTIDTSPPKGMTLAKAFQELGKKVDIEFIRQNLPLVNLDQELGIEKIRLILINISGNELENKTLLEKRELFTECDLKRALYTSQLNLPKANQ